jgi:hypothetical protein
MVSLNPFRPCLKDKKLKDATFWAIIALQCTTFVFLILAAANLGCDNSDGAYAFGMIALVGGGFTLITMLRSQFSATSMAFFALPVFFLLLYILIPVGQYQDQQQYGENGLNEEFKSLSSLASDNVAWMNLGISTGALTGTYLFFQGMCRKYDKDLQDSKDKLSSTKDAKGYFRFLSWTLLRIVQHITLYDFWGKHVTETPITSSFRGFFTKKTDGGQFSIFRDNQHDEKKDKDALDAREKARREREAEELNLVGKVGRRLVDCRRLLLSERNGNANTAQL